MNNLTIGQIVISKAGRDKGKTFVIMGFTNEYVYLTDGNIRKVDKPKKKKIKHIQKTNIIEETVQNKLSNDLKISNSEIRKIIQLHQSDKS